MYVPEANIYIYCFEGYIDQRFGLNIFISQIDTYIYNNYKHYK